MMFVAIPLAILTLISFHDLYACTHGLETILPRENINCPGDEDGGSNPSK